MQQFDERTNQVGQQFQPGEQRKFWTLKKIRKITIVLLTVGIVISFSNVFGLGVILGARMISFAFVLSCGIYAKENQNLAKKFRGNDKIEAKTRMKWCFVLSIIFICGTMVPFSGIIFYPVFFTGMLALLLMGEFTNRHKRSLL